MPPALNLTKLEDQRRCLIRFIERCAPQGSPKNRVTIVFDGDLEVFGGMASPTVKIIFSRGESADDRIKKAVAQAENAKNIVVVTDDKEICCAVRALGAKTSGVRAFLGKAKSRREEGRDADGKYIPKSDELKITSEMEKIWL